MKYRVQLTVTIEADSEDDAVGYAENAAQHLIETCDDENQIVGSVAYDVNPSKTRA